MNHFPYAQAAMSLASQSARDKFAGLAGRYRSGKVSTLLNSAKRHQAREDRRVR